MRIVPLLILASAISSAACSPYREVLSLSELKEHERVIIGTIAFEGGDLSDWVSGFGASASIELNDHLARGVPPRRFASRALRSTAESKTVVLNDQGGLFFVGVPMTQPTYIVDIGVSSTSIVVSHDSVLPLLLKVPPSSNACDYVGAFLVAREGNQIVTEIHDTYERDKATLQAYVAGCDLKKTLATKVSDEEIAAALAKPGLPETHL
jgi:hypothetical protein